MLLLRFFSFSFFFFFFFSLGGGAVSVGTSFDEALHVPSFSIFLILRADNFKKEIKQNKTCLSCSISCRIFICVTSKA